MFLLVLGMALFSSVTNANPDNPSNDFTKINVYNVNINEVNLVADEAVSFTNFECKNYILINANLSDHSIVFKNSKLNLNHNFYKDKLRTCSLNSQINKHLSKEFIFEHAIFVKNSRMWKSIFYVDKLPDTFTNIKYNLLKINCNIRIC